MVLPLDKDTKSAEETQRLGKQIGHSLLTKAGSDLPRIFCLWGELGSGKTTFVRGLAKGLGINSRLLSPTFIIVRRYDVPKTLKVLYHMDLYRMRGYADIEGLGFADMLADSDALVVIEWPDRLGTLLPQRRIDAHFAALDDGRHSINIKDI
jgi:tRNA threonylcarbamoyladenosine biosynthesis protein TsaE